MTMMYDERNEMTSSIPDIDWDTVYNSDGGEQLREVIIGIAEASYQAGKHAVLHEGAARVAMLEAQSYWLDAARKADGPEGRVVAQLIANEFSARADLLRAQERPSLDEPTDPQLPSLEEALTSTALWPDPEARPTY